MLTISLTAADWLSLLTHFMSLSLLAVGGAITVAPDMHPCPKTFCTDYPAS